MVIGKLTSYLALGLVGAFLLISLTNPSRALATTQAIGGGGRALGEYGTGFKRLFSGIGEGGARLFDPLFTLRDLIYGPQAGVQTQKDVAEVVSTTPTVNTSDIIQTQKQIEKSITPQFTPLPFAAPQAQEPNILDRVWNWLGFGQSSMGVQQFPDARVKPQQTYRVHGQVLPLSPAAVSYYNSKGVTVSPISSQTTSSQNRGNATSGANFGGQHGGSWSGGGFRAAN